MASRPPEEGDLVLDRYRLQRLVGRGGAGTVWVADDERLSRAVAVKLLHPQPRVPQAAARLAREARTLALLRHPGLVTLLDFGFTTNNAPVMVMEYLEGVSLKELTDAHPFSESEVAAVLDQALAAIHACHEQGVIHRDLKPANVLVARASGTLQVKIIDFGIVALAADPGATALTVSGEVFGSLRFMPPEQWRQADIGPYTDLYALGCLAYHLLLGEPFIRELSPVKVFSAHLEQARPRPRLDRRGGAVSSEFLDVLVCACEPDWRDRYPDAPSMRAALRPFVGQVPTPPLPVSANKRSVERPISVGELLNARTAAANISALDGHTAVVDTSSDVDPGFDPSLDPGATLLSAPPSPGDVGLPLDLQTRLMAAVSDSSGQTGVRGPHTPLGVARIPSDSAPALGASVDRVSGSGPVSAGAIPRSTTGSSPRPAPLPPSRETVASSGLGPAAAPAATESEGPPWWIWLLAAAVVGGLGGFIATRM